MRKKNYLFLKKYFKKKKNSSFLLCLRKQYKNVFELFKLNEDFIEEKFFDED